MIKEDWMQSKSRGYIRRQDDLSQERLEGFMEAINRLARYPLKVEQVYIRSMFLCSNRVCEQDWGKFGQEALRQISELVAGQSVIVGHDRSRLPIARFFRAEVVEREDELNEQGGPVLWVRAWFYWMRDTQGAKDLLLNIDGGIYREVSISWRYRKASCGICGDAIQKCPHVPGRIYEGRRCIFHIEEVAEVLEGSIVYKGAESKTGFEAGHGQRKRLEEEQERQVGMPWRKKEIDEYKERLTGQVRGVRSMLILTDRPQAVLPLFWLGKQAGLRVQGLQCGGLAGLCGSRGGMDWNVADGGLSEGIGADLIWIRVCVREKFDPQSLWWKKILHQAKHGVWELDDMDGESVEELRKDLLIRYFPGSCWQMRTVGLPRERPYLELIKEEQ